MNEQEVIEILNQVLVGSPVFPCANCKGHIFVCDLKEFEKEHDDWSGLILWGHVEDNGCDDPELQGET